MKADPAIAPVRQPPDLFDLCLVIAEHAPLPMAAVEGPGYSVRYVNAAFCRLMGKPSEQLTGKPFADIVPADDECLLLLDRVVRTGKSESHTGSSPPKAHAVFWSYTMWPVLLKGRPLAVMLQVTETAQFHTQTVAMNEALTLGMVRQHELTEAAESLNARLQEEMAERSQAEQALRQNAWRLRYATESARLTFVEIDLASGVARTPENFADVMGYVPPAEQHASVGAGVLLEHVVASDRQRVSAALQEFFGGQSAGKLDYRVLGDDQIERWIETRWSTECDAEGKPLTSFATNLDITERKQTENALRQSEERFRALFDRGPIAMYSCDRAGVIQAYNRGAVKLWQREPKPGDTDAQFRSSFKTYLADGTLLPDTNTLMTRVLKGEAAGAHDLEVVVERPDGSRLTLVVNVVPLFDAQGKVNGTITCFYDITERSRLERETLEQAQALADLDRRKDEFLAMLSHELRNPLAAMSNAAHLLRLQPDKAPIQHQARAIIERQVGQLKNLVDDLLEVSRISTGRVQLRREPVAVSDIVERALETAQPLVEHRGHELTVSLPPQPIWLQADAARLEQVVVNLLTNAAKYTDEGGRIWLTVEDEGETAVLRVRDTGIGIAPELLPRIFDLFTQAERSLDRSQGGLGIGLCLVQRLVDLHGGSVEVSSVLGQGSEFVVRLPAISFGLPQFPSPLPPTATAQPHGKRCRVLVVEDNVDAAQSLGDLLKVTGYEVGVAHDGPGGLEAVLDFRPDAVLLDIGLPGLTGLEVAKRIRELPEFKHIVLVAMTGYGQEADRQRSQEAGFDHHLVKPADFGDVEKILETVSERVTPLQ